MLAMRFRNDLRFKLLRMTSRAMPCRDKLHPPRMDRSGSRLNAKIARKNTILREQVKCRDCESQAIFTRALAGLEIEN